MKATDVALRLNQAKPTLARLQANMEKVLPDGIREEALTNLRQAEGYFELLEELHDASWPADVPDEMALDFISGALTFTVAAGIVYTNHLKGVLGAEDKNPATASWNK